MVMMSPCSSVGGGRFSQRGNQNRKRDADASSRCLLCPLTLDRGEALLNCDPLSRTTLCNPNRDGPLHTGLEWPPLLLWPSRPV